MRQAIITRETKETNIQTSLLIEGRGQSSIDSGIGFMDHMLDLFTYHGRFDIKLRCNGDIEVDPHHSCEDIGISLGRAFDQALGDRRGIRRYGQCLLPMDEALVMIALDISGRPLLGYELELPGCKAGSIDTESIEEFWSGLVRTLGITLHIKQFSGHNTHHIIEACFKGVGRALCQAVTIDPQYTGEIPSSKGILL